MSKAMDFLWLMMRNDQKMDCFTSATIISDCASVMTLERGMEIHAFRIKSQLEPDVVVDGALVDMYSKCGRIDYSSMVFRSMPLKNEFSWNSMISGYESKTLTMSPLSRLYTLAAMLAWSWISWDELVCPGKWKSSSQECQ